jgi:hypothetical protein
MSERPIARTLDTEQKLVGRELRTQWWAQAAKIISPTMLPRKKMYSAL